MASSIMTVRLEDQLKTRLEKLADVTQRSKSFLTARAISEYLDMQEWQMSEIQKGIREADAGYLTDHQQIIQYWEQRRADSMDRRC